MYKKIVWLLVFVLALIIAAFIFVIYTDFDGDQSVSPETTAESKTHKKANDSPASKDAKKTEQTEDYVNPFNEKFEQETLIDDNYLDYLHKMSHQKVIAETKWGFYEITDERMEWLLDGLDKTKHTLENRDLYESILKKWRDGDFSEVDKDHNAIWRIQGGTLGKASGIMSEEMEKEYIENTAESK